MRWEVLLVSETRLGKEFREMWRVMKEQAEKTTTFLEEEVKGPLASWVHGARDRRMNGTTLVLLWEHRDKQVVRALEKAICDKDRRLFHPAMVILTGISF